jgi:hypothetical protein
MNNINHKIIIRLIVRFYIISTSLLLVLSCQRTGRNLQVKTLFTSKAPIKKLLNKNGKTIKNRFNTPKDFSRLDNNKKSFAYYLQNFPLKPHDAQVHLYNNKLKYRQDVHAAVLDIDVGNRDLQQCADATMRLRAEFLYKQKQYDQISFNFTNGFIAKYSKWRKGYHIKVKGNKVSWSKHSKPTVSYTSFRKYLNMVFSYAGTLSLEKELESVVPKKLEIGNIFIQGGSPGHAIIVMDMAKNSKGEKVFLIAQSYMPAQEIHVLKNPNDLELSPWYSLKKLEELVTPEWIFTKEQIKKFE